MNSLSAKTSPASPSPGLTAAEVATRLSQFGPNTVREERPHPVRQFLERFWAPIPWLLEATIIIQLFLGERVEAGVIAGLLVLNAVLGFFQEGRAQKALGPAAATIACRGARATGWRMAEHRSGGTPIIR